MFSKILTQQFTDSSWAQIERLRRLLDAADAVAVGAGAGLSASAGMTYDGARFRAHFADFAEKYGIRDMYSGGFYPFETPEEYWAWWSRQIYWNRYDQPVGEAYRLLLELLRGKDYFVLTTNVDHCFQQAGFDKRRLFYTQGDYGLWQCARPCHQKTYDNEAQVRRMAAEQRDMKIPAALVPRCPVCGGPMAMNLRVDDTFVQDEGWYAARSRYQDFLRRHRGMKTVYLELGVGNNTPVIIKYPFWRRTAEEAKAAYVCVNVQEAYAPNELGRRALCIQDDITRVLRRAAAAGGAGQRDE